ncbi:MAG TPA: hypothetical protein VNT51_10995 [Miltoncostaeaceae bacterium]|jgi:hypothetical protein|nr:hypothetical protein [Miltoncostaeaceae bacterium]
MIARDVRPRAARREPGTAAQRRPRLARIGMTAPGTGYRPATSRRRSTVMKRAMVWAAPLLAGYVWKRMRGRGGRR